MAGLPSVLWMAPMLNAGGYSSEALSFALGADPAFQASKAVFGVRQFAEQQDKDFIDGLSQSTFKTLVRLLKNGVELTPKSWDVVVCHATPDVWHEDGAFGWGRAQPCPPSNAAFHIGRTMYETDRVPEAWVPRINAMHEVWVPSEFAVEQFANSGVERSKLVVMPEAVDSDHFDPYKHDPLPDFSGDGELFRFLSVFKFEKRKGWDLLLQAYFEEFSAEDPVQLQIKTQAFHTDEDLARKVADFAAGLSGAREPRARFYVMDKDLPMKELPRLYKSADAFVLPSRGEGWGRPHVEAMSMGLPVIATNWSGSTAFLKDHCTLPLRIDGLVDVEEGNGPAGHRWAEPSLEHLRSLMRWAAEHRDEAREIGKRARAEILEKFSPEAVARDHLLPRFRSIKEGLAEAKGGKSKKSKSKKQADKAEL